MGTSTGLPVTIDALDGALQLSLSEIASCALRTDLTAWCWGDNVFGDLGNGEWGSSFTFPPVEVELTDIVQIAIGFNSCAIRRDQSLWCWGVWRDGERANAPLPYPWVEQARALPLNRPRCLVMPNRTAMCRGFNYHGEVGDGTKTPRDAFTKVVGLTDVQTISASLNHTCALTTAGAVYCWGGGSEQGTGSETDSPVPLPVDISAPALFVTTGLLFSGCAIGADQRAYCWGANGKGQLGDGTADDRLTPTPVVGLQNVRSMAMGSLFSCALLEDRSVWCWGDNSSGQLGDGSKHDSYVPVRVKLEADGADAK